MGRYHYDGELEEFKASEVFKHAGWFNRWRLRRLIKRMTTHEKVIFNSSVSYRKEGTFYISGEAPLPSIYWIHMYVNGGKFVIVRDEIRFYKQVPYAYEHTYDESVNAWYTYDGAIVTKNALFKWKLIYSAVMSAAERKRAEAESAKKFEERIKEYA